MIRYHIRNISGHLKDPHNLRHEIKDGRELPEVEMLLETLLSEDVPSSVILTVDSGKLEMIYLQTTAMKKSMHTFPEVILMDSTYRCNNHKIPLNSIMVMDGNVRGHIAAYALLNNITAVNALCFLLIRI